MKKIFTLFAALACVMLMFAAKETVYFVNAEDWTGDITVHGWGGSASDTQWPGVPATKESEQIAGKDVWSFTADAGAYANIIFTNKKNGDKQTGNLKWTAGKYYVKNGWYTKEEAATAVGIPTPTYDYYVAGSFNGWVNPDPSCGMALVGDVYKVTLSLDAGEHQMKVTNGTWDNAKGYDAVGAKYEEVSRAPGNDGNILVKLAAGKEVVVVYNKNTDKITFEGLTATGETPETSSKYYVTGTFNGWENPDHAYAMTGEGNIYKKDLTLAAGAHMLKVTNGTWDDGCNWGYGNITGAYEEVSEGTNDEGEKNGNILITLVAEKTVTVVFDADSKKISFEGLTESQVTISYVLMGVNDDWSVGIAMTKNEGADNEEYMLLGQNISEGDSVKVVRLENGEAKHWCGNVKEGVTVTITPDDKMGNIILTPGAYDFYYDVAADAIWIAESTQSVIGNIAVEKKAIKIVRNGQLYILREGVMYNIFGQIAE